MKDRHHPEKRIYRSFESGKNLTAVLGSNVVGKTTAIDQLYSILRYHGLHAIHPQLESTPLIDSAHLLQAVHRDVHQKHHRRSGPSAVPFIITTGELPDQMRDTHLDAVSKVPADDAHHFAEFAASRNLVPGHPADYSAEALRDAMLKAGFTPEKIRNRFQAIIHITADLSVRRRLNDEMNKIADSQSETDKQNSISTDKWKKNDEVLLFYGLDDFDIYLRPFFEAAGVKIYDVVNDGTPAFFKKIKDIAVKIAYKEAARTFIRHSSRRPKHMPPVPNEPGKSHWKLSESEYRNNLESILHPQREIQISEGERPLPEKRKTYQVVVVPHVGSNAAIALLSDGNSQQMGKVLFPGEFIYRSQSSKEERNKISLESFLRMAAIYPHLKLSLRGILASNGDDVNLTKSVKSKDDIHPDLEYMMLMPAYYPGDFMSNQLKSNRALLQLLPDALIAMHKNYPQITSDMAYKYGSPEAFIKRLMTDILHFIPAYEFLLEEGFINENGLRIDDLLRTVESFQNHPVYKRTRDYQLPFMRNTHGNLYTPNMLMTSFGQKQLIRELPQMILAVDPAEMTEHGFPLQTPIAEDMMTIADAAARTSRRDGVNLSRSFIEKVNSSIPMDRVENRIELVLQLFLKSIARFHFSVRDGDITTAVNMLGIVELMMKQIQGIFIDKNQIDPKKALKAGVLY